MQAKKKGKKKQQKKGQKEWYKAFRWFFTSSNLIVICGKNAQQNEELLTKHLSKKDIALHTKEPGSPFCVIKVKRKKLSAQDIDEVAQFCACFSQQWKAKAKHAEVHAFRSDQIMKEKGQKTGTFTMLGKIQKGEVKLELGLTTYPYIKTFYGRNGERTKMKHIGELKAVPLKTLKKQKRKPLIVLKPGKTKKEDAARKIHMLLAKKYRIELPIEEIMKAIPAGGFACL